MRIASFFTGLCLLSMVSGEALAQISCDLDGDGDIDRIDINLMIDGGIANGTSNVLVARRCALQCSLSNCEMNTLPVANAGPDQTAVFGALVTLDGTGSTDVDGDSLTYRWSLTPPAGSAAVLSDPTAPRPTFQVDGTLGEVYVAQLIVNDGIVDSASDTVSVTIGNTAPVASAGPDQTATFGALVTLDGTGSTDVDGDSLTYRWSLTPPAGSAAVLSDPTAPRPTFDVDLAGDGVEYVAQLIVNDGTADSQPDTVTIRTGNTPPVAAAGPDQTAVFGETVTLDGTGSTDVDGDSLTYSWSLTTPAGSTAVLSDPTAPSPTFGVDLAGDGVEYVAQLIVNDGTVNSGPDTVTITIGNTAPVANAGPDQSAVFGDRVTLDGSGSTDVDGDPLTYRWSLTTPAGSTAVLSDPTAPRPTFQVDGTLGDVYVAQLIVNDGTVNSGPDTVTITIDNTAPVANAGPNQVALFGDRVTLDGTGSTDVDGDPLTYRWSLSKPAGSTATLSNPTAPRPTFQVDGVRGDVYVAQLIVNDGIVDSGPDTVTVTIGNTAPVANAGPDETAVFGDVVTLDGTGSTDVDGDSLTYRWSLTTPAGSAAVLSDPTAPRPTFQVDAKLGEVYVAQLIVNDGTVDSAPDTVTITTEAPPPVANAGPDQTAVLGDLVILDGTGSSSLNGAPLTYRWSLTTPAGSAAVLSDPTAPRPTFQVDGVSGDVYVAQLIVNDGIVDSAPDTVTVTIGNTDPVANAGPDQVATFGDLVTLDGTGSSDADNDPLTYRWSLSAPAGRVAALSDPTAPKPTFRIDGGDVGDVYVAQLIVNDGTVDSVPDTVAVTAVLFSGSPSPVLSNMLQPEFVRVGCVDGYTGSSYYYRAEYVDLTGDVSNSAVVRVDLQFSNGGTDSYVSDPFFNTITGDGFSGTVTAFNCLSFGSSNWVDVTLTIQDDAGNQSNPVTSRAYDPGGVP